MNTRYQKAIMNLLVSHYFNRLNLKKLICYHQNLKTLSETEIESELIQNLGEMIFENINNSKWDYLKKQWLVKNQIDLEFIDIKNSDFTTTIFNLTERTK